MGALKQLFNLNTPVGRSQYLAAGFGLMLLKYSVDAGSYFWLTGELWDPLAYLDPVFAKRMSGLPQVPTSYLIFLVLWALPFLWVGVGMSSRRARDAGLSPWLGLVFLVPMINYLAIAALALAPPKESKGPPRKPRELTFRVVVICIFTASLLGVGLVLLMTEGLHYYGTALFLSVPFLFGAVSGYIYNLAEDRGAAATLGMLTIVLLFAFMALLLFALEGVICLVMAYPLAWMVAMPGSLFGRTLARISVAPDAYTGLVLLCLPLGAVLEQRVVDPTQREVITSIVVDAPPEVVWEHVVSFSDLPAPESFLFQTGIAYPLRARIDGSGVGAVRRCEFSTGDFVEPITVWDAPRRLAFDVQEQPIPMEEWSFYASLSPAHLTESFRSLRGEFRLTPTTEGGTLLEGSTWYALDIGPTAYWELWADGILHRIHQRVLEHVRQLSEAR